MITEENPQLLQFIHPTAIKFHLTLVSPGLGFRQSLSAQRHPGADEIVDLHKKLIGHGITPWLQQYSVRKRQRTKSWQTIQPAC